MEVRFDGFAKGGLPASETFLATTCLCDDLPWPAQPSEKLLSPACKLSRVRRMTVLGPFWIRVIQV